MKKILSLLLVILMLTGFAMPVSAATMKVCFTDDSSFVSGGVVTVDIMKTMTSISSDPSCTSDVYNAYLEGFVDYGWWRNDSYYKSGISIQLTDADKGCQFQCIAYLFSDAEKTQQCGVVSSDKFSVPNTGNPALTPTITTTELPTATLNVYYDFQIQCSDKNATFELFRSPDFDKTGLTLSSTGRLTGTPKNEGIFVFTVMTTNADGGEDTRSFEFHVTKAAAEPDITTTTLPKATVGQYYSAKIQCSDPDATIQEYYNPGKANDLNKTGLVLTQHGDLEGTPKTAGTYTFTVSAVGEGGEDYQTLTLTVEEAEIKIELVQNPDKMTYNVGDKLDLTGLKVKITKADGTTVEATDGDMLEITDGKKLNKAGDHEVTLTYEDVSIILTVKVEEKEEETEPTETTEETDPTEKTKKKSSRNRDNKEDDDEGLDVMWIAIIGGGILLALIVAVVVVIIVSKKRKNS